MQRLFLLLLTLFALYACASSVPHSPVEKQPLPGQSIFDETQPVLPEFELPALGAASEVPEMLLPPSEGAPYPHIALLLPLRSVIFGNPANAVQQGFMAAANLNRRGLPVRAYGDYDENTSVVAVYRQAIANGALAVVGPLTRNGVAALAAERNIPIPTLALNLALNLAEGEVAQQLYFFGMAAESEARQIALLAKKQGLRQSIVIATRAQLSQRLQFAFEEEWHNSGGMILREIEFNDDPSILADITDTPDTMVFLATNAEKSRLIRPYLSNKMPVYSTSQIFVGNDKNLTNYDLNGIRFVDMPWLLQPDHTAVMIYPRAIPPLPADRERFYALGIDAYRLIQLMLTNRVDTSLPLDGVSGYIRLNGHVLTREPILAIFQQGQAQLSDGYSQIVPEAFPAKIITVP